MKKILQLCFLACITSTSFAQSFPDAFHLSDDYTRLIRGGAASEGFYDESVIDTVYLNFDQADYWTQMQDNYCDKINVLASLTFGGETYDSVGVRFKGQTSYSSTNGTGTGPGGEGVLSDKKSFNIQLDWIKNHDIEGYETLNLNNCYQDPTFMREILFENLSRNYIPAVKVNYVELVINGESWGLYPNVQQLDKKHAGQWFFDEECSRWRAEDPNTTSAGCGDTGGGGGPGGGGPGSGPDFGVGSSSINYLGEAISEYEENYTLKKSYVDNSWEALIDACEVVDMAATFEDPYEALNEYIDLDASLWHLAVEIIFSDDDSYIHKGGMDYFVYYDVATQRILPIEYDGNSVMMSGNTFWSPFYNENDSDFALLYKLLSIPELRERYKAHFRTILADCYDLTFINNKIDSYASLIDNRVYNDPQKIYTYAEFLEGVEELKEYFITRKNYLESNAELSQEGIQIVSVNTQVDGVQGAVPNDLQELQVNVELGSSANKVILYYGTGIVGRFDKVEMQVAASSSTYEAQIPAFPSNTQVRYYVEVVAPSGTRTYEPVGAEHDVYFYQVSSSGLNTSSLVINELMASNGSTVADTYGEYDDWVELYNNSSESIDLSGYYLSDRYDSLYKWSFPDLTIIEPYGYVTIWLDKDEEQGDDHANFKLSSSGEGLYLSNANQDLVDEVVFFTQQEDVSYGRFPNGTGDFTFLSPTYNSANAELSVEAYSLLKFEIFPNPASNYVDVVTSEPTELLIYSIEGKLLESIAVDQHKRIALTLYNPGIYFVKSINGPVKKLIIKQ